MTKTSLSIAGVVVLSAAAGCVNAVDPGGAVALPPTYDELLADTYQEPGTGIFIVDGDVPVLDEKRLHLFYDQLIADFEAEQSGAGTSTKEQPLALATSGGADVVWTAAQKLNLTYCVSSAFGSTKQAAVTQAMVGATAAWEAATDVHFVHDASQDGSCTASNNNVLFDVNPVNAGGQYIARSFFPDSGRSARNVLINPSGFQLSAPLTLTGVLRHELGHVLGFRHEHTRPEAGACFEDNNWRPLTPYDSASVMHYPQCNGTGDGSLSLTALDKEGAASVYGASGTPPPPPPEGNARTTSSSGSVGQGQEAQVGSFAVVEGSTFTATMSGTGNPNLYVQFGAPPTTTSYTCRPYTNGANETCTVTVPAGATEAYVMVRGYASATYTVNVSWLEPDGAAPPPPPPPPSTSGTEQTDTQSGSVARRQNATFPAYSVVGGTHFTATMTGSGDPDLYVRFGAAPSTSSYDCRPYVNGATESCDLTVPDGQTTAFVMVRGYTAATYAVTVTYTTP